MTEGIRSYQGAVAIITGGASGIGAALARGLVAGGARVIIADRQEAEAAALAKTLGESAEAVALDVRDAAAFEALVAGACERHGRLDFLFNNAGTGVGGEVKDHVLEDWRYLVEVNLMGVIHGVQAAYRRMVAQGFGHIVNTASMAGLAPTPFTACYSATKHAVVGLSRSLRIEARLHGVRVSALCPGVIRTPLLSGGRYGYTKGALSAEKQLEMWNTLRPMDPDAFAAKVLRRVARNEAIIIEPSWWRAIWWLDRLAPALSERMLHRNYVRIRAMLREETS